MSRVANNRGPLVTARVADYESAPMTVANAVAVVEDETLTALPSLSESVDVDALQSLVETGGDGLRITFEYYGHRIVVTAGTVAVH